MSVVAWRLRCGDTGADGSMGDWGGRCLGRGRGLILRAPPAGQSGENAEHGQQGIEQEVILPGCGTGFGKQTVTILPGGNLSAPRSPLARRTSDRACDPHGRLGDHVGGVEPRWKVPRDGFG